MINSKSMTSDEFVDSMDALKEFLEERGDSILGDRFIETYINVVEIAVGDEAKMVTWFVYENDFGKRGLEAWFDDKPVKISTALQLYYFVIKREE